MTQDRDRGPRLVSPAFLAESQPRAIDWPRVGVWASVLTVGAAVWVLVALALKGWIW